MTMPNHDVVESIRTRGAMRVRSDEEDVRAPSLPVRTRGAVRTRSVGTTAMPSRTARRALALNALLKELREQVDDLPLTGLIRGWGQQAAQAFLALLSPLLRSTDALWLLPTSDMQRPLASPALAGAVVLDLTRHTDQRTYHNLVGDLIFFPALEAAEATQTTAWQQRARALIVDSRGPQGEAVLQAGCAAGLVTYRWSGEATLEEV